MKIKKADNVMIISGKDRGKTGRILKVFPEHSTILVDGVNMRKHHERPRQQGKKGEIVTRPLPVHVSNVMLVCSKCGKPARIGYSEQGGAKGRVCKKCGSEV